MTDDVAPVDRESRFLKLKVELVDEEHESFRDWLITILEWERLAYMTITLRGGKEITIGADPKRNPQGVPVHVRVGKDFIQVDIAAGASAVPIYEIVRFSEIACVQYF